MKEVFSLMRKDILSFAKGKTLQQFCLLHLQFIEHGSINCNFPTSKIETPTGRRAFQIRGSYDSSFFFPPNLLRISTARMMKQTHMFTFPTAILPSIL